VGVEVFLTPDQEAFVQLAIKSGRFRSQEVREALRQWEERERKRAEFLATIDDAKASLARGEGRPLNEQSMSERAEEVSARRGRKAIAALMTHRIAPQEKLT
jgi:Arc/MetJ-type ribon-helix-helix transcriptional regulator